MQRPRKGWQAGGPGSFRVNDDLVQRTCELADELCQSPRAFDQHLAMRLHGILSAPPEEQRPLIKRALSMTDVSWLQLHTELYRAMLADLDRGWIFAPEVEDQLRTMVEYIRESAQLLRELVSLGMS